MSAVDTLNEALLASYLEANIEEFKGPLTASKFAGSQWAFKLYDIGLKVAGQKSFI